jgi:hypothetical protein
MSADGAAMAGRVVVEVGWRRCCLETAGSVLALHWGVLFSEDRWSQRVGLAGSHWSLRRPAPVGVAAYRTCRARTLTALHYGFDLSFGSSTQVSWFPSVCKQILGHFETYYCELVMQPFHLNSSKLPLALSASRLCLRVSPPEHEFQICTRTPRLVSTAQVLEHFQAWSNATGRSIDAPLPIICPYLRVLKGAMPLGLMRNS